MEKIFSIASKMYRAIRPVRSPHYLAWVRSFPCIACGTQKKSRDAAHVGPHGMGQKACDLSTVPACRSCHQQLHRMGRLKFEMLHGIDLFLAIDQLQDSYTKRFGRLPGEEERAA